MMSRDLPAWADPLTQVYSLWGPPWPCGPVWRWPSPRWLAWNVNVQCRDSVASHNTVPPQRGLNRFGSWHWGPRWHWGVPTCSVVAGLRNGNPWRCRCPPGRCEGKRGTQERFVPW